MARGPVTPAQELLKVASRPVIVTDIDGVLAFLTETLVTALNAHFGLSIVVSQMRRYWIEDDLPRDQRVWLEHQFQRGVFYENTAPDYSAIAAINAIHADGYHVTVSSDRPTSTRGATDRWLSNWRVHADEVVLKGAGGKRQILEPYGPDNPAILFDDDPGKALTIARPGVEVWSPQRPWTPADWRRYAHYWVFPSWEAVLARLGVDPDVPVPQFSHDAGPAYTPHGDSAMTHEAA